MDLTKPSGVLYRLRKRASEDNFISKLPQVNSNKLYEEQSKEINEGNEELSKLTKEYKFNTPGVSTKSSNKNTPGHDGGPIKPLEAPPLESPPFSVAPPAGNVFPTERPVALDETVRKEASFVGTLGTLGRTALRGLKNTGIYRGVASKLTRNPELAWKLDRAALVGTGLGLGGAGVALNYAMGSYDKMPNLLPFTGK